ncbi:hypothetical protein HS088_TW15G00394 [Tripterygium wilfordii]|uniref:Uncharacterized protein n=1 Tax=Tripterygium wilfordii TaxID=458696 RepID=A0A7J7CLD5_TRIWF|nr:uncharacterized protein LOC119980001 [Tripterygium wilfordii]KAF5734897.1 hypothetical protein HS088_TW15G00394 [Tripterygium wilfordii]
MGLHMLALASKINFLSVSHSVAPVLVSLICPFALKVAFSVGIVRRGYADLVYAARLFFFQMSQIALDREPSLSSGGSTRWERVVRLVYQRVAHARRTTVSDADSFHTLSVITL